jgi:hypothetical protein
MYGGQILAVHHCAYARIDWILAKAIRLPMIAVSQKGPVLASSED